MLDSQIHGGGYKQTGLLLLHDVLPVGFPHQVRNMLMKGKAGF